MPVNKNKGKPLIQKRKKVNEDDFMLICGEIKDLRYIFDKDTDNPS